MSTVFQPGHTAVITGGASGVGLALAQHCLAAGMRVLVADRNEKALAAVAAPGSSSGSLFTIAMDVAALDDWARLRAAVDRDLGGAVHLLALNAGVGGATPWTDVAAFHRILDVNLWGVVHGIATLSPVVEQTAAAAAAAAAAASATAGKDATGGTAIVITGSKQGITNPPGTSPAYNASKAAVRSLAEQLAYDLDRKRTAAAAAAAPVPVPSVHLLVPGWTYTGLSGNDPLVADAAKTKPPGAWWPAQVVAYLVEHMAAGTFYVLCPDNDVSEADDRKRILWSAGDVAERRPPLSRWRAEYADEVAAWMKKA